ncbi:MAG TPA: radical SAM protein [bacterium]
MSAESYRITVKDDALAVTCPGSDEEIFTFDRAGRLFAAWVAQRFYRRGLDGRVLEKYSTREAGRRIAHRRLLSPGEAERLVDHAAGKAADALSQFARGDAQLLWRASANQSTGEALRLTAAAAAFDAEAARQDVGRFTSVYRPVGILPPDQYLALVIQLTEGCQWNRCTFCTFYQGLPFRAKSGHELDTHIRAVTAYLGEGLSLRHSLFLGEANAISLPTEDLVLRLDLVRTWLAPNGGGPREMYAFLDVFSGLRKTAQEFAELRTHGLRRVYLGVETGDDGLLAFLNKPQRSADALAVVQALKAAGLGVGVIVMAGVGGDRYDRSHVAQTLELLNAMPLAAGDLIYLSAFVVHRGTEYERRAAARGIAPLDLLATQDQIERLRSGFRFTSTGPRIARYDIEEFLY